jgi:uncharacterized protein YcbX
VGHHLSLVFRPKPPRAQHVLRTRILGAFLVVGAVDVVGTLLMMHFEADAAGSAIHSLWDAFFFTTVQLLTVSSQMPNPVTTGGRIVDIFLEVVALGLVSGIAGAFASFFFHVGAEREG